MNYEEKFNELVELIQEDESTSESLKFQVLKLQKAMNKADDKDDKDDQPENNSQSRNQILDNASITRGGGV